MREKGLDGDFDFGYRPETYWPNTPTEESVVAGIKGTVRRNVAQQLLDEPEGPVPEGVAEFLLQESLDEGVRSLFGRMHPLNLGGEFLPDLQADEVEIARVALQSVTGDVCQVRARPDGDGIAYRAVGEYWDEGVSYTVTPERATKPLTFGELIDLIDSADGRDEVGLVIPHVVYQAQEGGLDREEIASFISVSSAFYKELSAYYDRRIDAELSELADDEDDDVEDDGLVN